MTVIYTTKGPDGTVAQRTSAGHKSQQYHFAIWVQPKVDGRSGAWECAAYTSRRDLANSRSQQYRRSEHYMGVNICPVEAKVKEVQPVGFIDYGMHEVTVAGIKFRRTHEDHCYTQDVKHPNRESLNIKAGELYGTTYKWTAIVYGKTVEARVYRGNREWEKEPTSAIATIGGEFLRGKRTTRSFRSVEAALWAALQVVGLNK